MQPIQQAFEPVSICFASDDNYAPCYVTVTGSEAMILLFYIRGFQKNIRERY